MNRMQADPAPRRGAGGTVTKDADTASDLGRRDLLEVLDDAALIVTSNEIKVSNAAARSLFGEAIDGRDVRLFLRHPEALKRILAYREDSLDCTGIGELGRLWRLRTRPLGAASVLVTLTDRSENIAADKMRGDFVANASHELRTRLSSVLGYAETLAGEVGLSGDVRLSFALTIRDEAAGMLRVIDDLRSLSRIEADRFNAPNERTSIRELLQSALTNAAHVTSRDESLVRIDVPADLPTVAADRAQLVQALENLLGNALLYGCDDETKTVEVWAALESRHVVISIADQGPGISREHLPRLTQRFYRVDKRPNAGSGTGLGLSLAKHIIERHGGSLEIESELGVGTTVSVRLPLGF